jgi:catechol 2,3-dioxygenase-like lactoylglutathione lyase family enzyme
VQDETKGSVRISALGNLAVKVADIDEAVAFYRALGLDVAGPEEWRGSRRADVRLGQIVLTVFEKAIYENAGVAVPDEGFLHAAFFVDDLEDAVSAVEPFWGPQTVEGTFGRRRIAFVEAPGIRLEFMEDLGEQP